MAAVSASISTPVRPSVSAVTSMAIALRRAIGREVDRDPRQRQRVAQRDQLRRALGGLDRGDARDPQHVALLRASRRRSARASPAASRCGPPAIATRFVTSLAADVDHVRLTRRVEMGKMTLLRLCGRHRFPRANAGGRHSGFPAAPPVRATTGLLVLNFGQRSGILALACTADPAPVRCPSDTRSRDARSLAAAARPVAAVRAAAHRRRRSRPSPCCMPADRARAQRRFGAAHAQRLPDLGDESQAMLAPAQERKLGESVIRQIRALGRLHGRPGGQRLPERSRPPAGRRDSRMSQQEFEFFAVPDSAINAFALPGGYVGVNTGLILLTQNESELAAVLAHEISHVTQHHLTRMMSAQKGSTAAAARGARRRHRRGALRRLERRPGRVGRDGLGAQALAIQHAAQLHARERIRSRPHRLPASRRRRLRRHRDGDVHGAAAAGRAASPTAARRRTCARTRSPTSASPRPRRARRASRTGRCPTRSTSTSSARCCAATAARRRRRSPASTSRSPSASTTTRSPRITASSRRCCAPPTTSARRSELATLEKMAPPHPMIDAMAAHVYLDAGDVDLAIKRFETALARYPEQDAAHLRLSGRAARGQPPARRRRRSSSASSLRFPNDGRLHRTAAKAYADARQPDAAAPPPGRALRVAGRPAGAVTQLELAIKAGDGDFYQSSVVETRLRALRQELLEQQREGSTTRNG